MCGRFAYYSAAEAAVDLFGLADMPPVAAQYNIAPTDFAAVIQRDETGANVVSMKRWGLLPFWSKDRSMAARMINARAETVHEKPAYRAAFKARRCVVPADGYYEWIALADGKQPFYLSRSDGAPLAMAGLWEQWQDPARDNEQVETFTILTMAATDRIAALHHRMPVMLDDVACEHWLAGDSGNPPALRELNGVERAAEMDYWAVEKTVNNARNEAAQLIDPLADQPPLPEQD
ncbi:MAG: SOS response-associated peptidase [Pseudomonadota bacterium]